MIVGAGNLYETINNKAKHANFDVEILPPREDISKLFQDVDVFLLCSLWEGFGNVVVNQWHMV